MTRALLHFLFPLFWLRRNEFAWLISGVGGLVGAFWSHASSIPCQEEEEHGVMDKNIGTLAALDLLDLSMYLAQADEISVGSLITLPGFFIIGRT